LTCLLAVVIAHDGAWRQLLTVALENEKYTHVLFVPLIAGGLIFAERRRVFRDARFSPRIGLILLALAASAWLWALAFPLPLSPFGLLQARCAAFVVLSAAAFHLFYGSKAVRAALFPLVFLIAFVPAPQSWMEWASIWSQHASAEVTHVLFKLTGAPFFREGMRFSLPGLTIEVAEECSGIRSGIGLLIASLVSGHLLLLSAGARMALALAAIPITIFKNAVRIVVLSILGTYVSRDFITGDLHHRGGPVFAILSFALLALVLYCLIRFERRQPRGKSVPAPNHGQEPA
jgi:exosortase